MTALPVLGYLRIDRLSSNQANSCFPTQNRMKHDQTHPTLTARHTGNDLCPDQERMKIITDQFNRIK